MRFVRYVGTLMGGALWVAATAHAVVDHYVVTAPSAIMKGDSGIAFSIDPQDALNLTDSSPHRVLFVVPPGVTVEGASGTGDSVSGWVVAGVTNFTVRTNAAASIGFFDLRVRDLFDAAIFGLKGVQIEPTIVSYKLDPPGVPFTGTAGVGFSLDIRALGPGGVTITSYQDDVRLTAQIGDIAVLVGGSADTVSGASFVNGVASIVVTLFGTHIASRQNTVTANQVESYAGQPVPATGVTAPALTIQPHVYDHILMTFMGETLTPGTGAGKVGAPGLQSAGASVQANVYLVDQWHNPIDPAMNPGIYPLAVNYVSFFVGVPPDTVPVPTPFVNQNFQQSGSFILRVAGNHLIQASEGSNVSQSIVPVANNSGVRFKVTPDPMPNNNAVTPFVISVEAVDIFDNPLVGYSGTATAWADNCAGVPFGNNTIDTVPGGGPGAENTITFVAGQWLNRPIQVFRASNQTRLNFLDAAAGLSGASTCYDNDPGGPARLLFTLPGQTYTPGAYPGNLNAPSNQPAGSFINAVIRVTDLSWNQVSIPVPQALQVFMDNTVGFIEVPAGLTMPAVGDTPVNNIRLRTSSFRPLAAAIPQVLRAQIASPNILGTSDPIVVNPGPYSRVVVVAPGESYVPGEPPPAAPDPSEPNGKTGSFSVQSFNVPFPVQVYLTDNLFNPIQTPPYAGAWPSVRFALAGGGDIDFPAPNPSPMTTSLFAGLVTSRKMGANTVTVTDTTTPARNTQVSFTVDAGPVAKFVVSGPGLIQDAGVPFNLTVEAYDQFDNLARNFGGVVQLELWENGVPVPYAGTISPSSVTFVANPVTGGIVTTPITVSYAGAALESGADQLQVRAFVATPTLREGFSAFFSVRELGVWSGIVLTLPGETRTPGLGLANTKSGVPTPVLAGNTFPVSVTAVDSYGNRVNEDLVAELSIPTPNVFYNLGVPAQVTLSQGQGIGFIQVYTAGSTVVRASVTAAGFASQSTVTINPGSYTAATGRLLLLAPGEVHLPGSPSAPGKNSAGILPVQANTSMGYTILACDRFYNRDMSYSGNTISLTSDDGAISRDGIAINSGSGTVSNVYLRGNLPNPSTVRVTGTDQADPLKTSYSDVQVTPGATYEITVPATALVGSTFTMTVRLLDPVTGLPVPVNTSFTMEAVTSSGTPASVTIGVPLGTLTNGVANIQQLYGVVETIRIRITDAFNRMADSSNIDVTPNGLKYIVGLPGSARTTDDTFDVTVGLYDIIQDAYPIRDSRYQHSFAVSVEAGGGPAQGSYPVTAATLTDGVATFNFNYTKAEHIVVRANGSVPGFPPITGLDDMDITPGAYIKMQVVAPGEVALPGIPSLTGKDSSGIIPQAARESFALTVNAVDRYWNVVTNINTPLSPNVRLSASDGSLSAFPLQSFSNGVALFAGVSLNSPPQVTITASDAANGGIFPQSVVVPLTGRLYAATASSAFGSFYSGPPRTIDVEVRLYRYSGSSTGSLVSGYTGEVTVEPVTPALQPLPVGNLVITNPAPPPGRSNVFSMHPSGVINLVLGYRVAEDIILRFVDEDGWQGFSAPISLIPTDVTYVVTVPAESPVGPPVAFPMTITPRDRDTGTTAKNWTSAVTITPIRQSDGLPGTGVLQVTSVNIDGGDAQFQQAYSQSGLFKFRIADGFRVHDSTPMNLTPGPLAALATDLPAYVEAGSTRAIAVTLQDAFGNPIPNLPASFSLANGAIGRLTTSNGVTDALGAAVTNLEVYPQVTGPSDFTAASGGFTVRSPFCVLGPPATQVGVGGRGAVLAQGLALKPADTVSLEPVYETTMTLVSLNYRVDGGPWLAYTGPFSIPDVGVHTVEYYGVTQSPSGVIHTEEIQTAPSVYVSAPTDPSEGAINYPNPFRAGVDTTFIEYNLTADSAVTLTIYDLMGQRVFERGWSQGELGGQAGLNRVGWDGRNDEGAVVGNGGYVAVLGIAAEGRSLKRKIAVIK